MRHCLVCSSTVGATDFAASGFASHGIPWEVIPESTETAERLSPAKAKREGLKRLQ
jgi:hypothetical protein